MNLTNTKEVFYMPEFVLPDNFETYPEARKKAFLTMKELKEQGRRIVGVFCT